MLSATYISCMASRKLVWVIWASWQQERITNMVKWGPQTCFRNFNVRFWNFSFETSGLLYSGLSSLLTSLSSVHLSTSAQLLARKLASDDWNSINYSPVYTYLVMDSFFNSKEFGTLHETNPVKEACTIVNSPIIAYLALSLGWVFHVAISQRIEIWSNCSFQGKRPLHRSKQV